MDAFEEAAAFYQQAVNKSVESGDISNEGFRRNNLADTLRQLTRFDEARQEILRAIECKSQFGHASRLWTSWAVLAEIEREDGNLTASEDAKSKAIACYLAYRRDGGENHDRGGRISLAVTELLLASDDATATSLPSSNSPRIRTPSTSLGTFIRALQAIVEGSRDHTLADAPDLDYGMAAEILLLIETLEKPR